MTVLVVGSVHGSPGATRLALNLAALAPDATLVLEADPDGGRLAARLDLAVRPGLLELAGSARAGTSADDLWRFAQGGLGQAPVVVAHPAAEQVGSALRAAGQHIGRALGDLAGGGRHVVVDVGRLRPGSPAMVLLAAADHVVVVADNSTECAVALAHRAQLLRSVCNPIVVLNRNRPYTNHEVEAACGLRVWGVVPAGARRRAKPLALLHAQLFTPEPVDA
jgi:hypothetical protein